MTKSTPRPRRKTITLERTFDASLDDVWEMWTTKEGLEAWWGPDGFATTVHEIDLRPGGLLRYAMTATAPQQIAFLERAGMPRTSELRVTYDEVVPKRRLAFTCVADFVPGVAPYDASSLVELESSGVGLGVRMVMTIEAMHDETWTKRAVMGWESELGRLERHLAARR
jgi:uncharacterized protein YndB with AHSA1/START domain